MCFVGFLSIDSHVYAADYSHNYHPIISDKSFLRVYINNYSTMQDYNATIKEDTYHFSNPALENVYAITWQNYNSDDVLTFNYNPDLYDYYFIGNMVAVNKDVSKSTFKPTNIVIYGLDYATNSSEWYPMNDVGFYDIDSSAYCGFGWYGKIDFNSRDNIGISSIAFTADKDGLGNKPANLVMEMGILIVDKESTESATLTAILNQLNQMESSIAQNIQNQSNVISSAIGQSAEKLQQAIENQFGMDDNEDFGVNDIQGQVEEKLGVLNFTADTLTSFLDLFNANTVGDTKITFPSYTIEVQGETYTVWNNIEFDFSFLEENFGILITAVRTVTVLCVWLAVLSYLGKAKDQIIINRG